MKYFRKNRALHIIICLILLVVIFAFTTQTNRAQNIKIKDNENIISELINKVVSLQKLLNKKVEVRIEDGENKLKFLTNAETVADILKEKGIKLNKHDYTLPKIDTKLDNLKSIVIYRVIKEEKEEKEIIKYNTIYKEDSNLAKGKTIIEQEGSNGSYLLKREYSYANGEEISQKILSKIKISDPIDEVVVEGTYVEPIKVKAKTVSSSNTNSSNENEFKNGIVFQATAYTGGGITKSGIPAAVGYVAVDPDVVPLGTRLYIKSLTEGIPDYGYAIAADTGGAVNGYIVDLYMDDEASCWSFGRRDVMVYILD